ncbi:MAG: hypothetical protein ACI95S_000285, partial [Dinoroseobacter sp.]
RVKLRGSFPLIGCGKRPSFELCDFCRIPAPYASDLPRRSLIHATVVTDI